MYEVPALFGDSSVASTYVSDMIVVGAVDNTGAAYVRSARADFVKLYAPGVDTEIPYRIGGTGAESTTRRSGTSGGQYPVYSSCQKISS